MLLTLHWLKCACWAMRLELSAIFVHNCCFTLKMSWQSGSIWGLGTWSCTVQRARHSLTAAVWQKADWSWAFSPKSLVSSSAFTPGYLESKSLIAWAPAALELGCGAVQCQLGCFTCPALIKAPVSSHPSPSCTWTRDPVTLRQFYLVSLSLALVYLVGRREGVWLCPLNVQLRLLCCTCAKLVLPNNCQVLKNKPWGFQDRMAWNFSFWSWCCGRKGRWNGQRFVLLLRLYMASVSPVAAFSVVLTVSFVLQVLTHPFHMYFI